LEDRRNVGESCCNSGDGTDQRVQSSMLMVNNKFETLHLNNFLYWKTLFSHQNVGEVIVILTVLTFVKMHVEAASKCLLRDSGTL